MKFIPGSGSSPYWCSPNGAKPMLAVCAMQSAPAVLVFMGISVFVDFTEIGQSKISDASEEMSKVLKKYGFQSPTENQNNEYVK